MHSVVNDMNIKLCSFFFQCKIESTEDFMLEDEGGWWIVIIFRLLEI